MFDGPIGLRSPGLFITGTDTGVGKTVIACAVAAVLRRQQRRIRVGVSKPFSSGCRRDREGLVSEDAEALAHFADCRQPLDVINPIRFSPPLAPAVAAEQAGAPIDWSELRRSLRVLDVRHDALLVEGAGGLLVPLDPADPRLTSLDLIAAIGYPVLVVSRSGLGTLNHTAMTVRLLRAARCPIAGIVLNGYDTDVATSSDPSVATNRQWLAKMTNVNVLAVVPRVESHKVQPHKGRLDPAILDAVAMAFWPQTLRKAIAVEKAGLAP